MGLEQSEERPVAAVISRLTNQKGLDLFRAVIPGLLDLGAQLVILGMGDAEYERMFADLAAINPSSAAFRAEMNDALARQIYAGADIFLMPSAFEPCGLSQLLAMRYGAIPVVRETGGLADTVIPYNRFTDEGTAFPSETILRTSCIMLPVLQSSFIAETKPLGKGSPPAQWRRISAGAEVQGNTFTCIKRSK